MLLSARMLQDVSNVNSWEYCEQVEFTQGDVTFVYFQLIDSSVDKQLNPQGRRYMPAPSATLSVQIVSVDSSKTYTKTATQPFTQDPSIWRFQVGASDKMAGTRDLLLTLTESSVVTNGRVKCGLSVHDTVEAF